MRGVGMGSIDRAGAVESKMRAIAYSWLEDRERIEQAPTPGPSDRQRHEADCYAEAGQQILTALTQALGGDTA